MTSASKAAEMKRKLALTASGLALAAACFVASALPAFSADSGAIQGTVTAAAPPAPCLTVSPATLDFGTLAFLSASLERPINVTNCGTAAQDVTVAGTNASGSSGDWALVGQPSCPNLDEYALHLTRDAGAARLTVPISTIPGLLSRRWSSGESVPLGVTLLMPCQGSNGAGETKSFGITFTGLVA